MNLQNEYPFVDYVSISPKEYSVTSNFISKYGTEYNKLELNPKRDPLTVVLKTRMPWWQCSYHEYGEDRFTKSPQMSAYLAGESPVW